MEHFIRRVRRHPNASLQNFSGENTPILRIGPPNTAGGLSKVIEPGKNNFDQ
jgi:hypothetical protein